MQLALQSNKKFYSLYYQISFCSQSKINVIGNQGESTVDQRLAETLERQPSFIWAFHLGSCQKLAESQEGRIFHLGGKLLIVYLGGISQFISKLCVRNIQGLTLSIFKSVRRTYNTILPFSSYREWPTLFHFVPCLKHSSLSSRVF